MRFTLFGVVTIAAIGCTTPAERETEASADRPARSLSDPAPDTDGVTRVLVYHDMEGLAGQDDPRTYLFRHRQYYPRGREMLTADVNAVIAGLYDGGADEVRVIDAHGSGNPEPDLLLDKLDSRAQMIFRDKPTRPYVDLVEPGVYDAIAVVGMHAKTGSGGFAAHTFTLGMDVIMNGTSITETETIGYSFGRVGVPVIFASGDDKLEANLETMPWIEFVRVKDATSASTATLRPVDEARADLRRGAERAMKNRGAARVMQLTTPIQAALRAVPPATLEMMDGVPGIRYHDGQVTFEAADFGAAYDGVEALVGVARAGYPDLMFEVVRSRPDGDAIGFAYFVALFDRWWDYESGRWTPAPPSEPPPGRRYHGSN